MRRNNPEIPARYYARMGELLTQSGVDMPALLRTAGIRPETMQKPDAMLHLAQVDALVQAAIQHADRTDLALSLGRQVKLSTHSMVGFAMLSSPTVAYALRVASRYFRLIVPAFRMRYQSAARRTEISFAPTLPMSQACLHFHLETIAAATHWEVRELLAGKMPEYVLTLSTPEPPRAERFAELAEAHCRFVSDMAPGLRMVFEADFTHTALAMADASALQLAEARCRSLLHSVVAVGQVSDWVRMMLREASGGMPSLNELAHTLNLSGRTLDRYLKREGSGFRALAVEQRQQKARLLLDEGAMTITQIAYELGYRDAANFTRAFRQVEGCSPTQYLQAARTSAR